jgi:cobalt-zinc-cadmium efflux system membrane fusion protein
MNKTRPYGDPLIKYFIIIIFHLCFVNESKATEMLQSSHGHTATKEENHQKEETNLISLTPEQIKRFDIKTTTLSVENFQKKITLSGQVSLNENKVAHVTTPLQGVVKQIFKGLGDDVKLGENLATLQSRDMAEARSAYLAAYKQFTLRKKLYDLEEARWKKVFKTGTEFIKTRNDYENSKIDLEQKKQKLLALSLSENEINKLPYQASALNIYAITSPLNGKVLERNLTLGEVVEVDKQVFVVADLSTVWVNLAIPSSDLPSIKQGQKVLLLDSNGGNKNVEKIMYLSPLINDQSRTGRAIIELSNTQNEWRPGDFITAQVIVEETSDLLSIPREAIQTINGTPHVFLETKKNTFEAKAVTLKNNGQSHFVQILDGLSAGDKVVTSNNFILKAELGKSEAEHAH